MLFDRNTQEDESVLPIGGALDALSVVDLRPSSDRICKGRRAKALVDLARLRQFHHLDAIFALPKVVRAYAGSLAVVAVRDQPLATLRLLQLDRVLLRNMA